MEWFVSELNWNEQDLPGPFPLRGLSGEKKDDDAAKERIGATGRASLFFNHEDH